MEKYLFLKMFSKSTLLAPTLGISLIFGQFQQSAKLTASTRESRAEFGTDVAINNHYSAVGASREEVAKGAVYIYHKNGESWGFHQKINAHDGFEMAEFGGSIKFGSDFMVVSAGRADIEGVARAGGLYIYEPNSNSQWIFKKKLLASDFSNDALLAVNSTSLAVSGNTIVAGAPGVDSWKGAVYIFEKNNDNWSEIQKIESPAGVDFGNFGIGVSIYDGYLAVGASGENTSAGKIYIYKKNDSGQWIFHQSLASSDDFENSYFGNSISIYDQELVVGAYTESNTGNPSMAYIFKLDENCYWEESQKIESYQSSEHTYFGWMCEMKNDKLLITSPHLYGAEPGKTFVYKKNVQNNWEFDQELTPQNDVVQDSYGWSIAMNENEIIVGASRDDLDSNEENEMQDAGSAYIFNQANLATNENSLSINDVKIYPNPAKDLINITSKKEISSIEILDLSGKKISETKDSKINVSHLTKGIYLLNIKFINGKSKLQKMIKQ